MKIKKFESDLVKENEPYIILCFNVNLKGDDNSEGVLKGTKISRTR